MTTKAKRGKDKVRRLKKNAPSKAGARNWAKLIKLWYKTDMTRAAFARSQGIPISTAKLYLSIKAKNDYLAQTSEHANTLHNSLVKLKGKDDAKLHTDSLRQVFSAVTEIMKDSSIGFKSSVEEMSKREAGRLAIMAGETLLRVSSELQGIPDEDEVDGWPLTRCFSPFKYQRDFVLDTPSSVRLEEGLPNDGSKDPFVFAFIGGRGAGKTHVGAQKSGVMAWLNRGFHGCVLAPTFPKLRDAAKAAFLKACIDKGLTFKHLKTENAIVLFGDTKVYFRSMDDPDSVRGLNLAWAWPDEIGQLPTREAFDVLNGCIRGDKVPEPAILLTTTPKMGWLYDVLVSEAEQNRVKFYRALTANNPVLGDYEQRLRSSYDPKFAAQELDAEFIELFSGKAYWNYSSVESVFDPGAIKIHDGYPLDLCCDFNVSPMCWNISQDFPQNGHEFTYVFDEIHLDTAGTDITIKEFIGRYGESRAANQAGVRVWGDATGQFKGTSATRSDYQIIEDALKEADIPVEIKIGRSNPRQRDRVLSFNARLLDAKGVRKFFVSEKCKYTKIDLERTSFIPGTQQLDKQQTIGTRARTGKGSNATLTHHTDGLGYKVFSMWPVRGMQINQ